MAKRRSKSRDLASNFVKQPCTPSPSSMGKNERRQERELKKIEDCWTKNLELGDEGLCTRSRSKLTPTPNKKLHALEHVQGSSKDSDTKAKAVEIILTCDTKKSACKRQLFEEAVIQSPLDIVEKKSDCSSVSSMLHMSENSNEDEEMLTNSMPHLKEFLQVKRKRLRSEVAKTELWEGFPVDFRMPRLKPRLSEEVKDMQISEEKVLQKEITSPPGKEVTSIQTESDNSSVKQSNNKTPDREIFTSIKPHISTSELDNVNFGITHPVKASKSVTVTIHFDCAAEIKLPTLKQRESKSENDIKHSCSLPNLLVTKEPNPRNVENALDDKSSLDTPDGHALKLIGDERKTMDTFNSSLIAPCANHIRDEASAFAHVCSAKSSSGLDAKPIDACVPIPSDDCPASARVNLCCGTPSGTIDDHSDSLRQSRPTATSSGHNINGLKTDEEPDSLKTDTNPKTAADKKPLIVKLNFKSLKNTRKRNKGQIDANKEKGASLEIDNGKAKAIKGTVKRAKKEPTSNEDSPSIVTRLRTPKKSESNSVMLSTTNEKRAVKIPRDTQLEMETLLKDTRLSKFACLLWSSENRRRLHQEGLTSGSENLEDRMRLEWKLLSDKAKLPYLKRAHDATEYKKTGKEQTKRTKSYELDEFVQLSHKEQDNWLSAKLKRLQVKLESDGYRQLMLRFTREHYKARKAILEHNDTEEMTVTEKKELNKRTAREVLFRSVTEAEEKLEDLIEERNASREHQAFSQFSETIKKISSPIRVVSLTAIPDETSEQTQILGDLLEAIAAVESRDEEDKVKLEIPTSEQGRVWPQSPRFRKALRYIKYGSTIDAVTMTVGGEDWVVPSCDNRHVYRATLQSAVMSKTLPCLFGDDAALRLLQ